MAKDVYKTPNHASYSSNSPLAAPATDREPPLSRAMAELTAAVMRLSNDVEVIAKRLEPVLGPETPTKADAPTNAPMAFSGSALQGQIVEQTTTLLGRAYWLETLLERLELP
jgi:hypothetical protein